MAKLWNRRLALIKPEGAGLVGAVSPKLCYGKAPSDRLTMCMKSRKWLPIGLVPLGFAAFLSSPSPAVGQNLLGCWERVDNSTRSPTSLTYCFSRKGQLHGWDIADGHGVDFSGTWRGDGTGRVRITFEQASATRCKVKVEKGRRSLILSSCDRSSIDGTFSRASHPGPDATSKGPN